MSLTLTIEIIGTPVQTVTDVPYIAGNNVEQVLEAAYDANPSLSKVLSFSVQYWGTTLGSEVVTLDAVSNQSAADGTFLFWELLVNGTVTPTGVDSTFPEDGDTITWSYTEYSPERHDGTNYEGIRKLL